MNLEENIRIAAEVYILRECEGVVPTSFDEVKDIYIAGAKSQAAKDYWYNEFKRQKIQSDSGQDQSLRNQPLKPSECFHGKSTLKANYATVQKDGDRRVTIVIPDLTKLDGVPEEYQRAKQYQQYIDEHPDRPISFDNWKYMVEHYEKPELISKEDIISHEDHCKSIKCVIVGVGSQMIIPEPIQYIVPIADAIPEKIQLTSFYDKISVPKEWDTRKEKKVSHKRNNKRK